MMQRRPVFDVVLQRLREPRHFIQVLLGPRQVGKTTLAHQAAEALEIPYRYTSADLAALQDTAWLHQQWEAARELARAEGSALLIIDEAQKVPHWSEVVKHLWDEDTSTGLDLYVLMLGSSPWLVQKGLSESLAGRFEIIPVTHWSYSEMQHVFGWSLDRFLYFGGYPGAAPLADENDSSRWISYINDAIIETTLSRDILLTSQIHKPVLLRRAFQLGCNYSGQLLSYNKMVGELQDAGNVTTLAHYVELLAGAGLLTGLQKFAGQQIRRKGSIPKFQVYNNALMTAQSGLGYYEALNDRAFYGRMAESAVGAHLLNGIRGTQIHLYYWREDDREVDFVLQLGQKLIAIEVKSGVETLQKSGMDRFVQAYRPDRVLLVGEQGIPIETFFSKPPSELFI